MRLCLGRNESNSFFKPGLCRKCNILDYIAGFDQSIPPSNHFPLVCSELWGNRGPADMIKTTAGPHVFTPEQDV